MSAKRIIRFGLIGCGQHAQWAVVPALRAARGVRLTAAADLADANLDWLADPAIARYTDYRQMLAREALDAVYIATPVEAHAAAALAALAAGRHVLTEKPMAVTAADCRRMLAAARRHRRLLAVDFESRYIPGNRLIRRWIAAGRIGRVQAIHLAEMWDGHKTRGPLAERRRRFCDSSGCLDCGIHKLDLARYFAGGGAWRAVRALGAWCGENVRYPPHIAILAALDTGVLVTLNASFAFTAYIPRRTRAGLYGALAIIGDRGVIVTHQAPGGHRQIELAGAAEARLAPFQELEGHAPAITRLLEAFAVCIRRRRPLPPEIADGVDGLQAQICVAAANRHAVRAGDTGRRG